MPTKQESKAEEIGRRLARALIDIEECDGDPSEVIDATIAAIDGMKRGSYDIQALNAKESALHLWRHYYIGIYDFAKATGHSVKHIYEQIRLGKLAAKKIDRKWKIPERELSRWPKKA